MESIFQNQIKTALYINIVNERHIASGLFQKGESFYTIQLAKIFSGEQRYIERKLSEMYELVEELRLRAYKEIPTMPEKKKINIKDAEKREERRDQIVTFLRELVGRRDIRNSQEVIEFLDLDDFCPELLIKKPQLITRWNCNIPPGGIKYKIKHCIFLPSHNLFVLGLNSCKVDKKGKKQNAQALFQIVSFKQLACVRDSYIVKNGEKPPQIRKGDSSFKGGSSTHANTGSDDTSFTFDAELPNFTASNDGRTQSAKVAFTQQGDDIVISQRSQSERALRTKNYLRESMAESFALPVEETQQSVTEILHEQIIKQGLKIRAICFCENLGILSLAMSDGAIQNYKIEVSAETCDDDDDDEYGKQDNVLCKRIYTQTEGSSQQNSTEEEKMKDQQRQYFDDEDQISLQLTLTYESFLQVHSKGKIIEMKADVNRGLLYSAGVDKKICITDINKVQVLNYIKVSNVTVMSLVVDQDLNRLYIGTGEGLLLIMNVSPDSHSMTIVHSMSFEQGLVPKSLDVDNNRNLIFCMLNNTEKEDDVISQVQCIQLDQKNEKNSVVVDTITLSDISATCGEQFRAIAWLSRVQCTLLTSSDRGILRFLDLQDEKDRTYFQLAPPGNLSATQLVDFHSTFMTYNRERNLIFAGAKDGRIGVWHLPETWRSKEIDTMESEFEQARRQMMKMKKNAKPAKNALC